MSQRKISKCAVFASTTWSWICVVMMDGVCFFRQQYFKKETLQLISKTISGPNSQNWQVCFVSNKKSEKTKLVGVEEGEGLPNRFKPKPFQFQPWARKTMKNEGFGYLKPGYLPSKTSKNVGFGVPWNVPLSNPNHSQPSFGTLGAKGQHSVSSPAAMGND